jgi:peptidoglycan/xylan/chitin deacetylase (PgdA/CDA1 family)
MGLRDTIKKGILKTSLIKIPLNKKKEILTILCIHGVTINEKFGKTANYEGRHIHKDAFADILEYLLRYFHPIVLEQLNGFYYKGKPLPKNPIFITFDDGFGNNYDHAFSVLKQFNCPATIFLPTGYIDNKAGFWVERLEYSIHNTKSKMLEVTIFDNNFDFPLYTNEEKEIAYKTLLRFLKNGLSFSKIEETVQHVCDYLGFSGLNVIEHNEDYRFLTWDEIKEMSRYGISFGGHTVNHVNLTCEDIENAEWEIKTSRAEIEKQLGNECIAFCYPFGRSGYSSKIEGFLKDAGFKFSFQLGGELNDRKTNPLLLNRIPLGWDSKKEDVLWHILRE